MKKQTIKEDTLFGHPTGLWVLFSTEMWERFSFYGMRAILALFLAAPIAEGGWNWAERDASLLYGLYTTSVYLMCLLGGMLPGRLLSLKAAILWGALAQCLGHFLLAFHYYPLLFAGGLFLLAIGTGLLKTNISSIVGTLYKTGDARRDGGFSIFYMGINVGALLAPLVAGLLAKYYGFQWGFASAGVGMIFSVLVFIGGNKYLKAHPAAAVAIEATALPAYGWLFVPLISLLGLGVIYLCGYLGIGFQEVIQVSRLVIIPAVIAGVIAMLAYIFRATQSDKIAKDRLLVLVIVFIGVLVHTLVFEQAGNSFTFYTQNFIARALYGYELPAAFFQAINPLCVVLFSLPVALFWNQFAKRFGGVSIMLQFGSGIILLAFSCLLVVLCEVTRGFPPTSLANPLWLVAIYWVQTISELCIMPVALSFVTKAAPARFSVMIMGIFWSVISLGGYFCGEVGALADPTQYGISTIFFALFVASLVVGLLFIAASKKISKMCHGLEKEVT